MLISLPSLGFFMPRILQAWVGSYFLLQGIFLTQGSNRDLLHCRQILYHLSYLGSPSQHCYMLYSLWSEVKWLSSVWLFATPWTVAHQAPPSMEFSRQEYCSRLPFPSPGDLPNWGIEPRSPTLRADALPFEPPGKPLLSVCKVNDRCAVTGHGQTLKEVILLVTHQDACIKFPILAGKSDYKLTGLKQI